MVLNISIKFLENISNGFKLQMGHEYMTKLTNYHVQVAINFKNR